ncbi:hypothetical protein L4B25_19525 [Salmonella enterica subsp. diarizonae serovar 16:z10:e,n,x,z15]|uniref:hypothetical protein n=1 Tax=Salmonella enterica TaxID=28901 RepID=UPI001F0D0BDD|nr:hypothetical protein [Salmonella enterica subsp. diarizonae serovar 16:z10:e,n,x,z15]MCH5503379.1 hypothetical protein [Salmonella enterica subsp. diarizonae serovar 16:z10:e,n,x,z15]
MKAAIKREINALNRIRMNVIEASVNKFDLIPFVHAGPRTADGRRVVYIDVLAWYAAKSDRPDLLYKECLFPDVWEDLQLRATFHPGYPRSVWKRVWRDFRCVLGNHNWVGSGSYRRELLDNARRLVESELFAETAV